MYFSENSLAQLAAEYQAIEGMYHRLLMTYVALPLKNARAREFASQGFPRRLKIMVRCISNVFSILPPESDDIPTMDQISDATINIQAFVFNVFGCLDNLAWIWIQEKGVTKPDGTPLAIGSIGLGPKSERVRKTFSPQFQKYLKSRDDWFEIIVIFVMRLPIESRCTFLRM
jgi:hypothetical protein